MILCFVVYLLELRLQLFNAFACFEEKQNMKAKNFFYVVIAGLCLILFYSLHLMTNNIDKDSESTNVSFLINSMDINSI